MTDANAPLPFHPADLELLSPEALARQMRVSHAFVRLCVATGCRTRRGKLSAAEMLEFLFANYDRVREAAGLPPLPEIGKARPVLERHLRLAHGVLTLLDFGISRASSDEQKAALNEARASIEHSLDRA